MKKIHCNGCGITEDVDMSKHEIGPVTLTFELDPRDWAKNERYEADLCPHCVGQLLHNYFGIDADGRLAVPAFIGPSGSDVRIRGEATGLRAVNGGN